MRNRLALAIVAITVVCVVADTAITAASGSLLSEVTWAVHGWPLATAASLGFSVMGALILVRHPRHRMGWLLVVVGLSSIAQAAQAYSYWILDHGGPGPASAGHVAGWVSVLITGPLASSAVTFVFLLAPDGHLPSRRWWWAAGTTLTGIVLNTGAQLSVSPTEFDLSDDTAQRGPVASTLFTLGLLLMLVGLIAAAVSLAIRLRRAHGQLRQQLLWIASAAACMAGGFVFLAVMGVVQGEQTVLGATPLYTAYLAFPIATAVAVLRHGLFDIELIVNRALVVALATAVVAVGYVAVVVALGSAVGAGGFWPSLVATAVVAMAFQPLRRGIVRVADRLAYGAAAVPYEALADLSRRLGDSPDPAVLLPAVADAAGTAVGARRATVRLHVPDGADEVAAWPAAAPHDEMPTIDFAVTHQGEVLGAVEVAMPPGRTLRTWEHLLVQDLADQAATAFSGARLTAELAQRVRQLDTSTLELAASRRRLISAGDAERSRLEQSIARQVLPHLQPLPARLEHLARDPSDTLDGAHLTPLITSAVTALEELREITRGVFPAQLARSGLEPALSSLLGRTHLGRLTTDPSISGRRHAPRVEAAAYFCVAELLHHLEPPIHVMLAAPHDELRISITGGAEGTLPIDALNDRIEAVDGSVAVHSALGTTAVELLVPTAEEEPTADDHTAASRPGPNADLVT